MVDHEKLSDVIESHELVLRCDLAEDRASLWAKAVLLSHGIPLPKHVTVVMPSRQYHCTIK